MEKKRVVWQNLHSVNDVIALQARISKHDEAAIKFTAATSQVAIHALHALHATLCTSSSLTHEQVSVSYHGLHQ